MKFRNSIMSACDLINATVHFNPNTDDKRKFSPHTILQEVYPIAVPCYIMQRPANLIADMTSTKLYCNASLFLKVAKICEL